MAWKLSFCVAPKRQEGIRPPSTQTTGFRSTNVAWSDWRAVSDGLAETVVDLVQKMMASMKPEDIAAMQKHAENMSVGGGMPGVGPGVVGDQQEQMANMMKDPGTMKAVQVTPPPPPPSLCCLPLLNLCSCSCRFIPGVVSPESLLLASS